MQNEEQEKELRNVLKQSRIDKDKNLEEETKYAIKAL